MCKSFKKKTVDVFNKNLFEKKFAKNRNREMQTQE